MENCDNSNYKKIKVDEKSRTYIYFGNESQTYYDIVEVIISKESGNHRLKQKNGLLHIVVPGYRSITIDSEKGDWEDL